MISLEEYLILFNELLNTRVIFQIVTGDKIEIHGRMIVNIKFGNTAYRQTVYVGDIADTFILELDILKEHKFTLNFKKNELHSYHRTLIESDIIEPSSSPWASPILLVRKKDDSTRFCVEYRKLNDTTKNDIYPLPRIDDTLDVLSGHKWFSTLNLKSGN